MRHVKEYNSFNNNQSLTDHELKVIDSIGEDVIRNRLKDMIGRN